MKLKVLLILMLAAVTFTSYAQDGGIRGKVVSRNGRVALSNVQVKIESLGLTAMTDKDGNFIFENLPAGSYTVLFSTPDFEDLNLMVRVGNEHVQDLKSVIIVPSGQSAVLDDAVFAEFDSDSSSSDTQALPSSLSSSKDLFNNIASYRFSEMRFNVRGYDSQYSDIYLNGIRFNDAMTGYGPWSLWSGLNDATRNQENYTGLEASDFGIGGIGGLYYVLDYNQGIWATTGQIEALGWLAVALVIFCLWRPLSAIWGSVLFGALMILYLRLTIPFIPTQLYKILPYVVTLVVLIIVSLRKKREDQPPTSLGLNYFREDR